MLIALYSCNADRRAAEAEVARNLKDPQSAQFRDVIKCPAENWLFTGEVNAKNSYGAYNGFKRFYASDSYSYIEGTLGDDFDQERAVDCFGKDAAKLGYAVDYGDLASDEMMSEDPDDAAMEAADDAMKAADEALSNAE